MLVERTTEADKPAGMGEIFEILVTSIAPSRGGLPLEGDLCWRPATDAYETEDQFVVQMDLAGMRPADIEVSTDGESLVVSGVRQDIAPLGKKHYFKMEINVGPFVRRIQLPVPVDPRSATARYRNGFLFVSLKKGRRQQPTRRRIDVDE